MKEPLKPENLLIYNDILYANIDFNSDNMLLVGEGKKGILVLMKQEERNEENMDFFKKICMAAKLQSEDYFLVSFDQRTSATELITHFKPSHIISFDCAIPGILNRYNKIISLNGYKIVLTQSLQELQTNQIAKTHFWSALQKILFV